MVNRPTTNPPSPNLQRMFSALVPWYDFLNRLLSLRQDVRWRRRLAAGLPGWPSPIVLDLAAGTMDVALELARRYPNAKLVAADFSHPMLCRGREKWGCCQNTASLGLVAADAFKLPFRQAVFQAVSLSFGIRNMTPREVALTEIHRVLQPGGWLAVLEFGPPVHRPLARLYNLYLHNLLPWLGRLLSRQAFAYQYLAASIQGFPGPEAFLSELGQAGFRPLPPIPLTGGIAWLYYAIK